MNKRAKDWSGDLKLDLQSLLNHADNVFMLSISKTISKYDKKYLEMIEDHLANKHKYVVKITPPCFLKCMNGDYENFSGAKPATKDAIKTLASKACTPHIEMRTCDKCGKTYKHCTLHGVDELHNCDDSGDSDHDDGDDSGDTSDVVIVDVEACSFDDSYEGRDWCENENCANHEAHMIDGEWEPVPWDPTHGE